MKQRISVAMATYCGATFLKKQLDSLLKQTRKPDEIIIYDDHSQDETRTIIQSYRSQSDTTILLYHQPKRVGYIQNFIDALKMTSGDVIFLCDQDDIWKEDKIESMLKQFEKHPDLLCINSSFWYIDENDAILERKRDDRNYGMCFQSTPQGTCQTITMQEILSHNIAMGCTMAIKKELVDLYLKHTNAIAPHDWELNFLAAWKNGLAFYNEPLLYYRMHPNNTTGNDRIQKDASSPYTKRKKNARTCYEYVQGIKRYASYMQEKERAILQTYIQFHEDRYQLLEKQSHHKWFTLCMQYRIYQSIVSKKGMLADFICSFQKTL